MSGGGFMKEHHKYTVSETDIDKVKEQARKAEESNDANEAFEQIAELKSGGKKKVNSNTNADAMKKHSAQAENAINERDDIIGNINQLR